jgi:two-component system LytT family response regulator
MKDLIRIVSVESEFQTLDSLKHILENTVKDAQLVKNYSRPDSFLQDCKAGLHDFDLLFLDIDVFPFNGLELINGIKKNSALPHFDIVFLTLNDNLTFNTFRHHAVDYLRKPLIGKKRTLHV